MPPKVRLDDLEAQKLDQQGDHLATMTQKEIANRLTLEAQAALPKGMPPNSPYAKFGRDELLAEAARLDMRFGSLLPEADLRLVVEHHRIKLSQVGAPSLAPAPPPVPMPTIVPVKIRGLKPSPTNTWVVRDQRENPKAVSVGNNQMAHLRNGCVIALNHYPRGVLQGIVDQGVKLIPIEDDKDED